MMAFMQQEAEEKAKEIKLKADEEAQKEKSRLVQEGGDAIEADYEKKYKSLSQSQQIQRSQVSNKTRLRILAAQQQLIDDLFDEVEKQLVTVPKDKAKYKMLLKGIILECAERYIAPELAIQARKEDEAVAKEAAAEAEKEYRSKTASEVRISLDETPLPKERYVTKEGKIFSSQVPGSLPAEMANYRPCIAVATAVSSLILARLLLTTRYQLDWMS